MIHLNIQVSGLTALLMHNGANMQIKSTGIREIPTPEEEAEKGLYKLEDGTLYVPTIAVRSSIIQGAGPFKVGRASLKSQLAGIIREMVPEECIPLRRNGELISNYDEIDTRRAVIQGQGILRSRPKINIPWQLDFEMFLDETLFKKSQLPVLKDVINRAGLVVGILDFRPGSPKNKTGWFGKYEITRFEVI